MTGANRRRRRAGAVIASLATAAVLLAHCNGSDNPSPERSNPPPSSTIAEPGDRAVPDSGASARTERDAAVFAAQVVAGSQRWLYLTDDDIRAAVRAIATPSLTSFRC